MMSTTSIISLCSFGAVNVLFHTGLELLLLVGSIKMDKIQKISLFSLSLSENIVSMAHVFFFINLLSNNFR